MNLGIAGRVAFCAGGSRGMGFEVARMLVEEGARVAIVARTQGDIDSAVRKLTAQGGEVVGIAADLTDAESVRNAVAKTRELLGDPEIVIGQTVHNIPGDFSDIKDPEHFVDSFRSYTMSTVYLLGEVLPAMKQAGWGRFVHIGSATAKEPEGAIHHVLANTTRPSTVGLLKTVADEYARYGITVNTVAPGWIATENAFEYLNRNVGIDDEEARAEWMRTTARVPAGRMGAPEEIASTIVYLCGELAGFVNGDWIEVDGGHHRSAF